MLNDLCLIESRVDIFLKRANEGNPVFLYGAGFAMPAIIKKLEKYNFNIVGICDSNPDKLGFYHEGKYRIVSFEEAIYHYPNSTFVISSPIYFKEIRNSLIKRVAPAQVCDIDLECVHYFEPHEFKQFFCENLNGFYQVLDSLADDYSKQTFLKVLKAHLTGEREDFEIAFTGNDDWYLFRSFMRPLSNSVFLDCGAYDGDTVRLFIEASNNQYSKIYAFEPDDSMQDKLFEVANSASPGKIEIIKQGLSNFTGSVSLRSNGMYSYIDIDGEDKQAIPVTTIDSIMNGAPVDIIKMDIEGSEFEALKGAMQTIKTFKPKLAICLYHKAEDFLRIPVLLMKMAPEYKFYIRHQSRSCTDTILFASL